MPRISYGFFLFSAADLLSTPQLLTFMQGREGWRIPIVGFRYIGPVLSLTHFPIEPLPHFLPSVQVAPSGWRQLPAQVGLGQVGPDQVGRQSPAQVGPGQVGPLRSAPLRLASVRLAPLRLALSGWPISLALVRLAPPVAQVGPVRLAPLSLALVRLAPLRLALVRLALLRLARSGWPRSQLRPSQVGLDRLHFIH